MTVYALLVGIDEYVHLGLQGAVNDVRAVEAFLAARVKGDEVRSLVDGAAGRQAVIETIRGHLGRAGAGDVALFWFSGHGSEAPVPPELARIEPYGRLQTLVCADSRRPRGDGTWSPDLLDKELSLLLTEVAAGGAHVVAVLDCCHAGGGTRGGPGARVAVRGIGPAGPPPDGVYLPGIDGLLPEEPGAHVLLAACELTEKAIELDVDGVVRGAFSHALLDAVARLSTSATYRELVGLAGSTMREHVVGQTPLVLPGGHGLADRRFLGGAVVRPATFQLRWATTDGWTVDAGACHGLPAPGSDGTPLLCVPGAGAAALLRVCSVGAVECRVEPQGWAPDPERVHPVTLSSVPMARCGLVVGGSSDDDPAALALVREAMLQAGPAGGPSPWVRAVEPAEPVAGERLWIAARVVRGDRVLRILRADGEPAAPDVPGFGPGSAATVVRHAEHIARWDLLRRLDNPLSGLAGAIRIEVYSAGKDTVLPPGREPLRAEPTGEIRVDHRPGSPSPRVFIRLRNLSDRTLFATLLDLTDQHRAHDRLFPCAPIGPRGSGDAVEGRPIEVTLPPGRRGRIGRDWLKVIAAEERFSTLRFEMPALGEPATRGSARTTRDLTGIGGAETACDWTTALLPIVTTVPLDERHA